MTGTKRIRTSAVCSFLWLALLVGGTCQVADLRGQEYGVELPPAYDGLQAGAEAAAHNNALRAEDVARQLRLNDWLRPRADGVLDGFYFPYPAAPEAYGLDDPDFADPWPLVWGWPTSDRPWDRVRQSLGQRYLRTGPNRWESRPIYADEPPSRAPGPPVVPAPRGREF